jgi:HAD superfamily hydrolase (TIGR01509 family)
MISHLIFDVGGVLLVHGQLNQPLIKICRYLRQQKFTLGIISNYSNIPQDLENICLFEHIFYYEKTRLLKPNPRLFDLYLKAANTNPSDCLFIDDSSNNVRAALNFGFSALYYQDFKQFKIELAKQLNILL